MRTTLLWALASVVWLGCDHGEKPRERLASERSAARTSSEAVDSAVVLAERPSQCLKKPVVCSTAGWCVDNPRPGANELSSVWGSGPRDIFAVGEAGTVLHFDGEWRGQVDLASEVLMDVWGSGSSDVYAIGRTGELLHYDGTRWSAVSNVPIGNLDAIWGSGPSDIWAVGAEGHAIHWNGKAWTASSIGTESLGAVWGTAPDNVYASAEGGLWHYDGRVWNQTTTHSSRGPGVLGGSGPENVLYGLGGIIDRWDGKSWKKAPLPWTGAVTGLWAANATSAFATTGDSVLRSEGSVWTKQSLATTTVDSTASPQVNATWGSGTSDVYAVGRAGTIHHFDGNAWSLEGQSRTIATLETLTAVWGSSSEDLYVGGRNLLHYDGCVWTVVLRDVHVRSIWGTSKGHVLVLGLDGQIRAWDGERWTIQKTPAEAALSSLWGRSADDVYAVGVRGATVHWDGAEWRALPPPPMPLDTLTSVAGTSEETFATDRVGVVYRLNGTYWERLPWTQVGNEVHTVGKEVYLWNSGGAVFWMGGDGWTELGQGQLAGAQGFSGTGKGEYYTVGIAGRLQHWDGTSWSDEASGFRRTLHAVWASESEVVAVGEGGVILRKGLK